jgi:hypothetical protein
VIYVSFNGIAASPTSPTVGQDDLFENIFGVFVIVSRLLVVGRRAIFGQNAV